MEIITGKYAEAVVFAEDLEQYARAQLQMLCDNAVSEGSRSLGKAVTEYYLDQGARILKKQGVDVPYPLTWLEGELMEDYLADVRVVQEYAALNREIILRELAKGMKLKVEEAFASVHNYIDAFGILRKGAISARAGEQVIIPVNMRDGVILGIGKGNADWNESAPHGSGRRIRRDEVKNRYTLSAFKKEMQGIYSTCIGVDTLDEAPFAYRGMGQMLEAVRETVDVTDILRPLYSFKAGNEEKGKAAGKASRRTGKREK